MELKFRHYNESNKCMEYSEGDYSLESYFSNKPYSRSDDMQFTGLQDISGVDIYKGDILHQLDPVYWEPVVVKFNSSHSCYYLNKEQLRKSTLKYMELIVVGNIHENPELLKGRE